MDTGNEQSAPQEEKKTPETADNKTLMSILAYLGPLVFVSYFFAKEQPFVKFHIGQGMVLFVIEAAAWVVGMLFWGLFFIVKLIHFAALIFSAIGIVHVLQGKEAELPLIGKYSKYFPL